MSRVRAVSTLPTIPLIVLTFSSVISLLLYVSRMLWLRPCLMVVEGKCDPNTVHYSNTDATCKTEPLIQMRIVIAVPPAPRCPERNGRDTDTADLPVFHQTPNVQQKQQRATTFEKTVHHVSSYVHLISVSFYVAALHHTQQSKVHMMFRNIRPKHHSEKQHGERRDQIRVMVHENNSGCCSLSELTPAISHSAIK